LLSPELCAFEEIAQSRDIAKEPIQTEYADVIFALLEVMAKFVENMFDVLGLYLCGKVKTSNLINSLFATDYCLLSKPYKIIQLQITYNYR
jgi:hypothetical protein